MNQYEDKELICICGEPFTWTAGEQRFLQSLIDDGKANRDGSLITFTTPKRCKSCRVKKKREYEKRNLRQDY